MISVGIDVSKEKSTVCIARPYGEIVVPPYDVAHTEEALHKLVTRITAFDEDTKVVMESTGAYHLPVLLVLVEAGLFVCAEIPFLLKKHAAFFLRKAKTDKIDAMRPTKYKVGDFAERYWHFDTITNMSEDEFVADYSRWVRENGYRNNANKAKGIYQHASQAVTTLSSKLPSTKLLVQEAVRVLRSINEAMEMLQLEMKALAETLPEYKTVRAMNGVGDVLASRIISENGDVRRFHSRKSLVTFAGIDAPPYQPGNFTGTKRHISKRGSVIFRKTGYEIIQSIKTNKPTDDAAVFEFIVKKELEGKPKKVANIAGLNKFLRIYYARVSEVYQKNRVAIEKTMTCATS